MALWLRVFLEGTEESARIKILAKENGPQGRPLGGERVRLFSIKADRSEEPLLLDDQDPNSNEVVIPRSGLFEIPDFRVSEWKAAGYRGIRVRHPSETRHRYFDEIEAPRQNGGGREPRERQREERTDMSGSGKKQPKTVLELRPVRAELDEKSGKYTLRAVGYVTTDNAPVVRQEVVIDLDDEEEATVTTNDDGRFELEISSVKPRPERVSVTARIPKTNLRQTQTARIPVPEKKEPPKAAKAIGIRALRQIPDPAPDTAAYNVIAVIADDKNQAVPNAEFELFDDGKPTKETVDPSGRFSRLFEVKGFGKKRVLVFSVGSTTSEPLELTGPSKPEPDKFEIEVDGPRDPIDLNGTLVFLVPVRTKKNGKLVPVELAGTATSPVSFGTTRTPQMLFDSKVSYKVTPEGGDDTFVVEFKTPQATLKLKVPGTDTEHEFVLVK